MNSSGAIPVLAARRSPSTWPRPLASTSTRMWSAEFWPHTTAPNAVKDGPSWLTLLGHTKDSLWSLDLFRTESILLRSHWVLVVMDQFTRRIIGFGVQAVAVDGPALCRMFNQAISGQGLPTRLSSDHDPLFRFHRWQANLRILERGNGANGAPGSLVPSIYRTAHRDHPPGVFGSSVLLDCRGLGTKAGVVQKLLQRGSRAPRAIRRHARRESGRPNTSGSQP